jgi:hypothetical protein
MARVAFHKNLSSFMAAFESLSPDDKGLGSLR